MGNHTKLLRIGTDTANATQFDRDPLRTLLFGFQTEFIYIPNFWTDIYGAFRRLVKLQYVYF